MFDRYKRFFESRSIAERIVLTLGILAAIFVIWHFLLWNPLQQRKIVLKKEVATNSRNLLVVADALKQATERLDKAAKVYGNQLQTKKLNNTVKRRSAPKIFVSSAQIITVLKSLLNGKRQLQLLELHKTAVNEFTPPQTNGAKVVLFKHGIMLKLRGSYFAIVKYLAAIERSRWPIFWGKIDYRVVKYPLAEVTITAHTLSDSRSLIHG